MGAGLPAFLSFFLFLYSFCLYFFLSLFVCLSLFLYLCFFLFFPTVYCFLCLFVYCLLYLAPLPFFTEVDILFSPTQLSGQNPEFVFLFFFCRFQLKHLGDAISSFDQDPPIRFFLFQKFILRDPILLSKIIII